MADPLSLKDFIPVLGPLATAAVAGFAIRFNQKTLERQIVSQRELKEIEIKEQRERENRDRLMKVVEISTHAESTYFDDNYNLNDMLTVCFQMSLLAEAATADEDFSAIRKTMIQQIQEDDSAYRKKNKISGDVTFAGAKAREAYGDGFREFFNSFNRLLRYHTLKQIHGISTPEIRSENRKVEIGGGGGTGRMNMID